MTKIRPGQIQPSSTNGDVIKTVAGAAVWGANTIGSSADAEFIRDTIGAALVAGTGMTITVNDAGDTITVAVDTAAEVERVVDAVAAALVAGSNVTITYNDPAGTITVASTGGSAGHVIEDEGTPFTPRANLDFVGAGVTVTDDSTNNKTVVTIPGGGAGAGTLTVQDENVNVAGGVTQVDFVGAGVTATSGTGEVVVTVPGYSDEQVRDVIGAALVAGAGVTITVNDAGDTITVASTGGGGGSLAVQDENGTVATGVTQIDFVGAGVTAVTGSGEVVVTIPGAGIIASSSAIGNGAGDLNTTSTSFVDALTTTIAASVGDHLIVTFNGSFFNDPAGDHQTYFAINIGGAVRLGIPYNAFTLDKEKAFSMTHDYTVQAGDISGGVVTVKAQWRVQSSGAFLVNRSSGALVPSLDVLNIGSPTGSAAGIGSDITFNSGGTLSVVTGTARWYNDTASTLTIAGVRATVGLSPAGSSILVDVDKNGTTIFTTQANRPAIGAGGFTSGKVTSMDITTLAPGDYLTCDIDQVGSSTAGSNLVIQVLVR